MKTKCTIFLIILLSITPLTKSFAQGGTWESDGEIPIPRALHAAIEVDSIIYVIGGVTADTYPNATPLVQAYDPIHKTWEEKAPMLTARQIGAACVLNGKIYTIGGGKIVNTPSTTTDIVEVYDPATDEWATCANLPEPRGFLGTAVSNGKIYAIGGMYNMNVYNNLYVYDPDTDYWTTRRPMPTPRNYISACSCDSGKIYVFGGAPGVSNQALSHVEMYDPITNL
jgi:N-acetylneuraminic acid mutarotase